MRVVTVGALALVLAAFGLYVLETEPRWYERLRYPLRYEQIVVGHAENYRLEPQLVAAVIYQESKFDADAESCVDRQVQGLATVMRTAMEQGRWRTNVGRQCDWCAFKDRCPAWVS